MLWIVTIAVSNWSGELIEDESYRWVEKWIFDTDQNNPVRQDCRFLLCLPSHMKQILQTEKHTTLPFFL